MAYEFQKLADVEAVEEFPEEGASVLIEHEGDIKKCPAGGIGGGGGSHIYRFEVDDETESISPTEQCDDTTISADIAAGIMPFAMLDTVREIAEEGITILEKKMAFIPLQAFEIMNASGGDYDGYKIVSIKFKSQVGNYSSISIEGHFEGTDGEIEWSFESD